MTDNWDHVGRNVQRLRKALGLTQQQLAKRSGVARPTISNLECGTTGADGVTVRTLYNLGRALGVAVWVLLEPTLWRHDAA